MGRNDSDGGKVSSDVGSCARCRSRSARAAGSAVAPQAANRAPVPATARNEARRSRRGRMALLSRSIGRLRTGLYRGRFEEAAQVALAHAGLAARDVVEAALDDPVLELVGERIEMLEPVDDEEQRLVVVDLEG